MVALHWVKCYTFLNMKKHLRLFLALFAVMGILNCFVLDPALASHHHEVCVSDDGCGDCFVCSALNHQTFPAMSFEFSPESLVSALVAQSAVVVSDPPSSSIFHPPLAV